MAKKAELLAEAKKLKLEVNDKNTVAEIELAIEESKKISEPEESSKAEFPDKSDAKTIESEDESTAKAGKRSEKGLKEAEEKTAKIERQKASDALKAEEAKPKHVQKPVRTKTERRGKKYREAVKAIDKTKQYSMSEALDLAIKTSTTKFDSTVELHVRLNVDPKQADQNIRDNVVLPSGTGKTIRVAVFAEDDIAKKAISAGADIAGNEEFLQQLDKGVMDFDVLVATPNLMSKLAKYARILGPKGLMPNPKSGTVTNDVEKAVEQSKAGKIEYRVDSTGIAHISVGKVSFGKAKLVANVDAVVASLKQNKPASLKSVYVRSINLTTSMGPSIHVVNSEI